MSLNDTPRSERLHIGIFGKRNTGKSSLINAITGHETALVSEHAGTTTDPVYKSMEIYPIGPCVLIDTAGFDDDGEIGGLRVEKTREAARKTDIALVVFAPDTEVDLEKEWIKEFKSRNIPVIAVLNKADLAGDIKAAGDRIEAGIGMKPVVVSSRTREGISQIHAAIMRHIPGDYEAKTITGGIVKDGDVVLLVMPQDIQAPKGRLILPQVQTLRELLDKKCIVLSVTTDRLDDALRALSHPPAVIITDSQVFKTVYDKKPAESKLTSFSVLFAGYKGDLDYYTKSAAAIERLTENSRVLIAEACTHAPLEEDIGREKIPKMLRKKAGEKLRIDMASGTDFPADLTPYDLIIHCGACMFNRKYVLSRIEQAAAQNVPMTNYGIAIAHLSGILDKISLS
ncbi:MAG: [FeFe] hydrogenase H-cluster maturation GTPase HydF [Bacillota bacterium]